MSDSTQGPTEVRRETSKLIDLGASAKTPFRRWLLSIFARPLERTLSLDAVNETYRRVHDDEIGDRDFMERSLDDLGVKYDISSEDFDRIPKEGPLVIVANHPFGGIEGIILGAILDRCRPDTKILGNYLLHCIPELRSRTFAVDPFSRSRSRSRSGLKQAARCLRDGGALITFPAGGVSHLFLRRRRITDPDWSPHIARLVRMTQATVLPVFFPGHNGPLFQLAGLVHPALRTAMLPRELINKGSRTIPVYAGNPLSWQKLKSFESDRALIKYLRINTYFLENRNHPRLRRRLIPRRKRRAQAEREPLAPPAPADELKAEVESLPEERLFVDTRESAIYIAPAREIPLALHEIGRLREMTFREVQEGTGHPLDLDRFDERYQHLFLWNKENAEVVGAYRLGRADRILREKGRKGLYTSTLYRFKRPLMRRLRSALELGRSFIRPEYQRKYSCLALLWRGIGAFVSRHPEYTLLFGPVSISQDYQPVSKDLIVQFLRRRLSDHKLARWVVARHPYHAATVDFADKQPIFASLRDMEDVSVLISEIEKDGKGIPVLLRQYLKLNACFLSFNVDADFSDCVDSLMLVDLVHTSRRLLKRFLTSEGYAAFCERHGAVRDDEKHAANGAVRSPPLAPPPPAA